MTNIYHEKDANLGVLSGKIVGIIGFGNLGRPIANNLRDSRVSVLVGLRDDETRDHAREDGFEPRDIKDIIPRCHILLFMLPGRGGAGSIFGDGIAGLAARASAGVCQRVQYCLWFC